MQVVAEDVLRFWLGEPRDPPLRHQARWFGSTPAFDEECRARFLDAIEAGARGELSTWQATPRGRLALVVLLDQLSRNVFRGTPRAFAQDAAARNVATEAMRIGDEGELSVVERFFLYLPFEHGEDVGLQHTAVTSFERLVSDAPAELKAFAESGLDYAKKHAAVIERFGRFPHRNAIVGRESTAAETAFLREPGSSF